MFTYLGLLVDDRVHWCPAVKATLARCRRLLVLQRKLQGRRWGNSQVFLLTLYWSLILSRLLYALPLLRPPQWQYLEDFHRRRARLKRTSH